ncbi:MAG: glycosyltransferase family 1 protein [Desulfobacteraceae bacterium]|nr:MAG: glycosyltransferase family 1 protein [Desulfobacteraceae bacterium]
MKHVLAYQVFPRLPGSLSFLGVLSRNLWWSWKPDAIELFRRIDPRLWEESGRNPIVFATQVSQERLKRLAKDDSFLAHLDRVRQQFKERVLASPDLVQNPYGPGARIAYFSMEFGIHESLPLFAGGLGVLAGDHIKSCSHMGLPMVAVGLLYRQGYFRQLLDPNGWQQETYPETDLYSLPLVRVKNTSGGDLRIGVEGPSGDILADVWKVMIGRIPLILLDANVMENPPSVRDVTARLYNSDPAIRLAQEVLLGIGGMRALRAMGIEPTVCHMNEGHSTFANLERLAQVMEQYKLDTATALQVVARSSVFTTHTPVAAGHDEFPTEMVRPYIKSLARRLKISEDEVLAWGRTANAHPQGPFSMFILGLRQSQYCNGVSRLHGQVARRMWSHVWPERSEEDMPITHVTNGVHISSFIAPDIVMLFERYLGPEWHYCSRKSENVERIDEIYDEELWRAHEMNRTRLISKVRELLVKQYSRRNAPTAVVKAAENALDPEVLTIGFARRFATYKRANLILRDPERLKAMLTSGQHPVQFIFAGKAHPQDNEGKELIRNIIQFTRQHNVANHLVFLEDYDMGVARHLVQGVDVWLNTPRRPLEACGTSGMKAAINGALNLSILDGWWDEGYTTERGWSIGSRQDFSDPAYQDAVENQALYNVLENDVIPCFYNRVSGNMPVEWLTKMKASMKMAMSEFCSHRMVGDYQQRFYLPAVQRYKELVADQAVEAKRLSILHKRLKDLWKEVRVEFPERDHEGPFQVEDTFQVSTIVHLGSLKPDEVDVELYYGRMLRTAELDKGLTQPMAMVEDRSQGNYLYRCTVTCRDSGRYGFTVRVVPRADDWIRYTPGLLTWG